MASVEPPDFYYSLARTLELEGGLTNHPQDPGGLTNFGITAQVLKDWLKGEGLKEDSVTPKTLTRNLAAQIYRDNYWNPLHLDELNDKWVAAEIFDTGVNCGLGTAVRLAQQAYNFLRLPGWEVLVEDGVFGPKTRFALNSLVSKGYRPQLILALNGAQFMYYCGLVKHDPERFCNFARGWCKRLAVDVRALA